MRKLLKHNLAPLYFRSGPFHPKKETRFRRESHHRGHHGREEGYRVSSSPPIKEEEKKSA